MANRRMFAKTIIDSDDFLDMPLSTQALYFHLSMRADDDGFINNSKKISRMIGASSDEMTVLIGKKFVIAFDDGIIVIKHWRMHNYIQKDRYTPTVYKEKMELLGIKENNGYTLDTERIQNGNTGKVRLGKSKVRLEEEKELEIGKRKTKAQIFSEDLNQLFLELNVTDNIQEALKDFVDHRKEIKSPMTIRSVKMMYKKLCEMTMDENTQMEILEQSIANGWKGIFDLKNNGGSSTGNSNIFMDIAREEGIV